MRYSLLRFFALLCIITTTLHVQAATDLPQKLQNARVLLDQPAPDSTTLVQLLAALKAEVIGGTAGALADSACVTIAEIARVTSGDPHGFRWAVELCLSQPDAPWTKHALRYTWPQYDSPQDKLEAADALLNRACREPREAWANEFKVALFRAYSREELWFPAAFLGWQLRRDSYPLSADDQLLLANSLLRSSRVEDARDVLFTLSANTAPNTPQALRASVELGLIEQVLLHDIQSKQQLELAWSIWHKHRKRPGFSDPTVANSAARANWELLQYEFAALEKTLQVSLEWSSKDVDRWCRDLEDRAHELLMLAPAYDAAVAVLIGRVQRMKGDALIKLAMYSSRPEDLVKRDRLLADAQKSYNSAADFFAMTAQRASAPIPALADGHWASFDRDFSKEATQRYYDVHAHAANQLVTWSAALWEKTPLRSFGQNGYSPRFDGIVHEAFPILLQAADYRRLAWRYAVQHPGLQNADLAQASLFRDFVRPVEELRKLCGSQWHSVEATATQISRTLTTTRNPDAVASMSDHLTLQIAEAVKLARESEAALDDLFAQLFLTVPNRDSLSLLAEHKLSLNREYAAMNRAVHESLDLATNSLDRRDPQAASLRSRLYKFSSQAAVYEMAALESGYQWAEANSMYLSGGQELYARLAERDPTRYPLRGGVWQAGR